MGFAIDGDVPGGRGGPRSGDRSWGDLMLEGFESIPGSFGPVVGMRSSPPL